MEAIIWKLWTEALGAMCPQSFALGKTAFDRFDRGARASLWDVFFAYQAKSIRSGYTSTEIIRTVEGAGVKVGDEGSIPIK